MLHEAVNAFACGGKCIFTRMQMHSHANAKKNTQSPVNANARSLYLASELYCAYNHVCASTNCNSSPCNLVSRGGGMGEIFSVMTLYLCQSHCAHNTCQLLLWVVRRTLQTTARCLYMMRVVGYWTIPRSSRNGF